MKTLVRNLIMKFLNLAACGLKKKGSSEAGLRKTISWQAYFVEALVKVKPEC